MLQEIYVFLFPIGKTNLIKLFNRRINSSYHIGRKAEINSVNFDMFSFTWVIIAKYVIVARKERLGAKTGIISQAWDLK